MRKSLDRGTCGGWTLPIIPILVVVIGVLTWIFGWIVPVIAVAIIPLIAGLTYLYDKLSHDTKCRYCNSIKGQLHQESGIALDRIKTVHEQNYPAHMNIRVYVDGDKRELVRIDYNGQFLDGADVDPDSTDSGAPGDRPAVIDAHLLSEARAAFLCDDDRQYAELIRCITVHLERDPLNAFALNNRAVAYWETGEIDRALEDFRKAAECAAGDHRPLKHWGMLLEREGRLEEASEKYTAAVRIAPTDAPLLRCRASVLQKLGDYRGALADLTRAIELEPDFRCTYGQRAEVHDALGSRDEAEADRRRAGST